jgi:hypothetical protein
MPPFLLAQHNGRMAWSHLPPFSFGKTQSTGNGKKRAAAIRNNDSCYDESRVGAKYPDCRESPLMDSGLRRMLSTVGTLTAGSP